jgi:hypothetical protein
VPPLLGGLAVLGAINLILGTKLVILALGSDLAVLPRAAWEAPLPQSIANFPGRSPLDAYAEITAHPVFSRSREPFRPPPSPQPPSGPVAPPPVVTADPGLQVAGVVVRAGRGGRAYLQSKGASGGGSWVSENELYQGWQVQMIDPSGVRIEQSGRVVELQLYPPR